MSLTPTVLTGEEGEVQGAWDKCNLTKKLNLTGTQHDEEGSFVGWQDIRNND